MKKIILGIFSLIIFASCSENRDELNNVNRVFRTGNKYYVIYKGNTFELPSDLYLTKDKKLEQYFTKGILKTLNIEVLDKSELLNDLNKYFPDGIDTISENEKATPNVELPLLNVNNTKHIDSIKFEKLLASLPQNIVTKTEDNKGVTTTENTTVNPTETLRGKKIEVLNANGISGFAKNIGDKLQSAFGIEYNAENYTKSETMNYVIVRNVNETEAQAMIENAGLKYVRILEDKSVKPEADFVLVTGNDNEIKFKLEVATLGDSSVVTSKIGEYNPEIVKSITFAEEPIEQMNDIRVVHNKADIYTAKLIAKKIGGNVRLVESDKMNNRIVVVSKN